jgi:hypothetical protein
MRMKQYWIECSAHRRTHQMADGKDERQRETTTDDGSHYRAQHSRLQGGQFRWRDWTRRPN